MKYLKSALIGVLLCTMLLVFSPIHAQENSRIRQGTCGENISWTYDEYSNTLTVSGTGAIPSINDLSHSKSPWNGWHKKARILIIESGITSIGAEMFSHGRYSKIVFPDTLTTIEYGAFKYSGLPDYFSIPDSVTTIKDRAFYNCSCKQLWLPENLSFLGTSAFAQNQSLTSVYIPPSLNVISDHAFSGCENLSDVHIPEGVVKIKAFAFHGTALTSLTIPNSVTYIENTPNACPNLNELWLGSGITEIEEYAFKNYKKVYYNGTIDQWHSINLITYNPDIQKNELITLPSVCDEAHQYQVANLVVPTCTQAGYTSYICKNCGHTYSNNYIQPTGHSFGNWEPYLVDDSMYYLHKGICQNNNCGQEYFSIPYKAQVTKLPDEINVSSKLYPDENGPTRVEYTYSIIGGELTVYYTDAPPLTFPLNIIKEPNIPDPFSSEIQPIDFVYEGIWTTIHYALPNNKPNLTDSTQNPSTLDEVESTFDITAESTSSPAVETNTPVIELTTAKQSSQVDVPDEKISIEQSSSEAPKVEQTTIEQSSTKEEESLPLETDSTESDDNYKDNKLFFYVSIFVVILCTLVGFFMIKKSNH